MTGATKVMTQDVRKFRCPVRLTLLSSCLIFASLAVLAQNADSSADDSATENPGRARILAAIRGMGGLEALRNVRTLSILDSSRQYTPQGEIEVTSKVFLRGSRQIRQDVVSDFGPVSLIYNGEAAWQITGERTRKLKERDMILLRKRLSRLPHRLLPEALNGQRRVEVLDSSTASDSEMDEVLVTDNTGDWVRLTIAIRSGQIVKIAYVTVSPQGEAVEEEQRQSDFRRVGNLILPFRVVVWRNGVKIRESTIHHYSINEQMSPALFNPPPPPVVPLQHPPD